MRSLAIITVLLLIASGIYYQFYYPPMVLKHKTQAVLDDFSKTMESKDRNKIGAALQLLFVEQPQIHLEVFFFKLSQPDSRPVAQDFDKPSFITFVDNIVFSLNDYGWRAQLDDFNVSNDRKEAHITFTSQEWGDGLSYFGGVGINMHFTSNTTCEGHVVFASEKLQLDKVSCAMKLYSLPKAGEENKLENPEAFREFLR